MNLTSCCEVINLQCQSAAFKLCNMSKKVGRDVQKLVKKEVVKQERKQHAGGKKGNKGRYRGNGPPPARGGNAKQYQRKITRQVAAGTTGGKSAELAKAMCCPNMYPSFRVQDGYASMPTGCESPFMCEAGSFSTVDGSGADALGIPADESWAIGTRDPRCTLRFYDASLHNYSYRAVDADGSTDHDLIAGDAAPIDHWTSNNQDSPHGPKLYTGVYQDYDTRWTLGTDLENINIGGLPASTPVQATIDVLEGDDVQTYIQVKTTTAGGAVTMAFTDFVYRDEGATKHLPHFFHWGNLRLDTDMTGGNIDFLAIDKPLLRQLALADWEDVEDVFEVLRFNAFNLMFSNTAAVLDKDGFTAGWQCPKNVDWLKVMMTGFHAVANKPQASRMEVKNGIHGFFKSTSAEDWKYLQVGDSDDALAESTPYDLYAASDTLIICNKIPKATGRAGYWTIFSCTEERHDSVWHNEGYPNHTRVQFERALEIQARVPQWHENPFHIKDIFNFIGRNKDKIKKTFAIANGATGNRAGQIVDPLTQLLDAWF